MGTTFSRAQLESILKIYLTPDRDKLLTQELRDLIAGFLEFCKVKDVLNNSNTASLIEQVYSSSVDDINKDCDNIFMSASSRFRFKKNLYDLFKKYLSNKMKDK